LYNPAYICRFNETYVSGSTVTLSGHDGETEGGVQLDTSHRLKEPDMYRVLLHNDHYTTMDFVVEVLMSVFHMTNARATQVMLDVHKKGTGICGVYTYDIAVTKVEQVHLMAKAKQFPLRCSCEKV